jgi:hypothetical protein
MITVSRYILFSSENAIYQSINQLALLLRVSSKQMTMLCYLIYLDKAILMSEYLFFTFISIINNFKITFNMAYLYLHRSHHSYKPNKTNCTVTYEVCSKSIGP